MRVSTFYECYYVVVIEITLDLIRHTDVADVGTNRDNTSACHSMPCHIARLQLLVNFTIWHKYVFL